MQTTVVQAYVGLGSNLGDGKAILQNSWQALGEAEGITLKKISSPYMTAPVDMTSHHWFTNSVGLAEVTLTPLELLQCLLAVEAQFGRTRKNKNFGYEDRSLDLDLLYYGDTVMDSPELILPHPRIAERLFVLVPLAELAPEREDCVNGRTVSTMVAELEARMAATAKKKQEIIKGSWI